MTPPARRLHVLMTADAVGGVWTYAVTLAQALARTGIRVTLAVMGPPPSEAKRVEAAAIPGLALELGPFKLEWMDEPWAEVEAAGRWLLDLAHRTRPDLVHLNGYAHGALPWPAPALVVAHSCVLSWWAAVKGEVAPPAWDRYREVVRQGLLAADFVVAPTRAMLDALGTHYAVADATRVIPNGVALGDFAVGGKEPFVLAAGRLWDEAKNLEALDRAAPAIRWPVRVAGDDRRPDGRRVPSRAVEALGVLPRPELHALLARAAIYAFPARYEPFGLSILEAAASGCALVLGDIASLREVWGEAALYVAPDDPAALADAVNALIADPVRRTALAEKARRRAGIYSAEAMGAAYAELYGALLDRAAPVLKLPA
jgi:glycosyltransferase involved in cell wall biosynthesis